MLLAFGNCKIFVVILKRKETQRLYIGIGGNNLSVDKGLVIVALHRNGDALPHTGQTQFKNGKKNKSKTGSSKEKSNKTKKLTKLKAMRFHMIDDFFNKFASESVSRDLPQGLVSGEATSGDRAAKNVLQSCSTKSQD